MSSPNPIDFICIISVTTVTPVSVLRILYSLEHQDGSIKENRAAICLSQKARNSCVVFAKLRKTFPGGYRPGQKIMAQLLQIVRASDQILLFFRLERCKKKGLIRSLDALRLHGSSKQDALNRIELKLHLLDTDTAWGYRDRVTTVSAYWPIDQELWLTSNSASHLEAILKCKGRK